MTFNFGQCGLYLGLCTRCSGFYLLCYALILSKCPYYAQPLHPLCSLYAHYAASCLHVSCKKAARSRRKVLLPEALLSAELESLRWDRLSLLRGKCAFPWENSWRSYIFTDSVGARSLSTSDTTSLLPASLLLPSSPAGLSFAACRDPATLEPSAILARLSCMHERRALRAAPHIIILPAKRLLCRHCALSPQGPIIPKIMPAY